MNKALIYFFLCFIVIGLSNAVGNANTSVLSDDYAENVRYR